MLPASYGPMTNMVRFHLYDKRSPSLRHPSFAGRSLAERMRSTTFALFGLAAAAGLALVAIFAQPGGPLLSPAPLPDEPSSSVGRAEAVAAGAAPKLAQRPAARKGSAGGPSASGAPRVKAGRVGGSGSAGVTPVTGTIGGPKSVGPSPASGGGENGGGQETPASTPPAEPTPAPESVPVSSPAPTPAPEKTPAVHVSLPEHSNSGHSGGNGIAATVHAIVSPPSSTPPVVVPPVVPGPPTDPGDNGNGHDHGHGK